MRTLKIAVGVAAAFGLGLTVAPAQSFAATYFSSTSTVSGTGTVTCPYGSRLTGGGADLANSDSHSSTSTSEYRITASRPTSNGWTATGRHLQGYFSSSSGWRYTDYSYSPRVYAICAR